MDSKTFKFMLKSTKITSTKDYALLKKRYYKVKSLVVPLKGSSSFSEYLISDVLKYNKPLPGVFKTLFCLKTYNITNELIKFFSRNKQILRQLKVFKGKLFDFSSFQAKNLTRLINRMKNLSFIDDFAKFLKKKKILTKGYQFTFPNNRLGGSKGNMNSTKVTTEGSLKRVYPLKGVDYAEYSPHLRFKRLFPSLKKMKINVSFLKSLKEINGRNIEELCVTADENTADDVNVESLPRFSELLSGFENLKRLKIMIREEEFLEVLELLKGLEEKKISIKCYLDFSVKESDVEKVKLLREDFAKKNFELIF